MVGFVPFCLLPNKQRAKSDFFFGKSVFLMSNSGAAPGIHGNTEHTHSFLLCIPTPQCCFKNEEEECTHFSTTPLTTQIQYRKSV